MYKIIDGKVSSLCNYQLDSYSNSHKDPFLQSVNLFRKEQLKHEQSRLDKENLSQEHYANHTINHLRHVIEFNQS